MREPSSPSSRRPSPDPISEDALARVGHARARVHGWTGPPPETVRLVRE